MSRRTGLIALAVSVAIAAVAILALMLGRFDRQATPAAALDRFDPDQVEFRDRVRVEVLNAAGRSGLARAVTARLREAGYDVVYYGNAERRDTSLVLLRAGEPAAAQAVATALGIDSVEVRRDPELLLEVTVLLGGDYSY